MNLDVLKVAPPSSGAACKHADTPASHYGYRMAAGAIGWKTGPSGRRRRNAGGYTLI